MLELSKETWNNYWRNLFNPHAPITRDLYNRSRWIATIILIPFLLLWFKFANPVYDEYYYNKSEAQQRLMDMNQHYITAVGFLTVILLMFIMTLSLELRMFKHRKVSSRFFIISNVLFFIVSYGYVFVAHFTGHDVNFFIVIILFLIPSFTTNSGIFIGRTEGDEYYRGDKQ